MTYNKILSWFIVNIILVNYGYSQSDSSEVFKKNTVYLEFLGNSATITSIHYDRTLIRTKKHSLDFSLGFGYYGNRNSDLNPSYAFPISLNWSNGTRNHHLDFGVGLTYNSGVIQERSSGEPFESMEALWSSFRLGYKYQRPKGGFFLRAGLTPLIKLKEFSTIGNNETDFIYKFLPLFGIGVGYTL